MTTMVLDLDALVHKFSTRVMEAVEVQARERVLALAARALVLPPPDRSGTILKRGVKRAEPPKARRTPKLGAKTLAVRRLQGRYLGTLRGLSPAARKRVSLVAKEKGVAAALAFAKSIK